MIVCFGIQGGAIVRFALPPLKKWIKRGVNSFPEDEITEKEWNNILKEIVWSLEYYLLIEDSQIELDIMKKYGKGRLEENWKRCKKGLLLLGKWLPNMRV